MIYLLAISFGVFSIAFYSNLPSAWVFVVFQVALDITLVTLILMLSDVTNSAVVSFGQQATKEL